MNDNFKLDLAAVESAGTALQDMCHGASVAAGWYHDPVTGALKQRNLGEMLALIHSEVSEALEGVRKNLQDDHLPEFPMVIMELADASIRIGDMAGYLERLGIIRRDQNLGAAIAAKMVYNSNRLDHKREARAAAGGKAF